jgi:putative component of membrane protein insertase Oxa1/YidC/SpoIIIJ protein YidD
MRFKWIVCLFLVAQAHAENPWGKDADLAFPSAPKPCKVFEDAPLVRISERLIYFHKNVVSPADGPRSSYFPNSSQYTLDAIRTYGFFRGFWLGCDRLMRENGEAWVYRTTIAPDGRCLKYDPIPALHE